MIGLYFCFYNIYRIGNTPSDSTSLKNIVYKNVLQNYLHNPPASNCLPILSFLSFANNCLKKSYTPKYKAV